MSADHSTQYLSDSDEQEPQILAISPDYPGESKRPRDFLDTSALIADGPGTTVELAAGSSGFLFVSIPNGVAILSANGVLPGKIALDSVSNSTLDGIQYAAVRHLAEKVASSDAGRDRRRRSKGVP